MTNSKSPKDHARDEDLALERLLSIEASDAEIDAALYKSSFRDFVPVAFKHAEPSVDYVGNWHIDAIAEHLQAVTEGQIKRLLINVPPGTMKSLLTCVLWPAWMWARDPALRFIFSSYAEDFTKRDARKMRNLVNSAWFRSAFPRTRLARASRSHDEMSVPDTTLEYGTTLGGLRSGAATSSGVTGKHVHGIVEDDPMKAQDAHSKASRDAAWNYHKGTLSSRLLPGKSWRVVVMQRLHVDDPAGRILREEEGYEHLCLPMHYAPKRAKATKLGWPDRRKKEGELIWPERMTDEYVRDRTKDLGPHDAAAQEEQHPTAIEGGIIKRAWMKRRWTKKTLPEEFDVEWISGDLALTDTGDPIALQHWGFKSGDFYLLKRMTEKLDFVKAYRAVLAMASRSKQSVTMSKVIENKASGAPMIELNKQLRAKIPGFEPWNPKGDKIVRLSACSGVFASECVVLPDQSEDPDIETYIETICGFPAVLHDDEVDATSQAILWFQLRHDSLLALDFTGGQSGEAARVDPALGGELVVFDFG